MSKTENNLSVKITTNDHDGSFEMSFADGKATHEEKFNYILSLLSDEKKIEEYAQNYNPNPTNEKRYNTIEDYKEAVVETLILLGKQAFGNINLEGKELATKHIGGILSDIAKNNGGNLSASRWLDNLYQSCAKAIGFKTGREKAKDLLITKNLDVADKIKNTLRNHQHSTITIPEKKPENHGREL